MLDLELRSFGATFIQPPTLIASIEKQAASVIPFQYQETSTSPPPPPPECSPICPTEALTTRLHSSRVISWRQRNLSLSPSVKNEERITMPHYKVVDYVYPTSGELARLILQYRDVEFVHEEVDSPDKIYEAEEEAPFGILPVLFVDEKIVAQGQGISRYLAREFDLIGKTNEEAATCDMIMDGLGAMFAKMRSTNFAALDSKQQMTLVKQMMQEDVPRFLEKYENFLQKSNLESGYFASEQLTWCDLGVALTLAGMQIRQPSLLDKHPHLAAFVEKVTSNEVVATFIDTELAPSAVLRKNSL